MTSVKNLLGPLVLLALVSTPPALPQARPGAPADTLAEVGTRVITSRDLIERIELMPWPGKERGASMDSVKFKALRSLAAEEVLALEADAEGVIPDSALRVYAGNLERLFVRDELYRTQVRTRTTVSEKEVRTGLSRFAWRVRVLMINASGESEARAISRILKNGGNTDSLIAHPPAGRARPPVDTVAVTFGLLELEQENAVYALSDALRASEPILTRARTWVVLRLLGRETDPEYAKLSLPERREKVKERIRKRNEMVRAERYSLEVLSGSRGEAQRGTFSLFAEKIRALMLSDSLRFRTSSGYRLDRGIDAAFDALAGHLGDVIVTTEGRGMTIGEVLEGYRTYEGVFPTLEKKDFYLRLNASIRDLVGRELLAREGYRLHLESADEVRHDVGMWSGYWRARALMRKLSGDIQVSNDDVLRALEDRVGIIGRDYEINVREILTDSLREALSCMEKIVGGAAMEELARQASRRKAWGAKGGESGYFPLADHPALGIRALDAAPGKLVGPVRLPEGYSVFTVLGVRRVPGDTTFAFDSLKTVIRAGLLEAALRERLNRYVASAAGRYNVTLYDKRLGGVEIPPVNIVTRRMLGFGGSVLAVPALFPLWEWTGMSPRQIVP
jgi:hypothetical protein